MADDLLRLPADKFVDHLGDLLRRVGFSTERVSAHQNEEGNDASRDQQFQREGLIDPDGLFAAATGVEANQD